MDGKKRGKKGKMKLYAPKNPYHWYGLLLIVIGVAVGGVLGAVVGSIVGVSIIKMGYNKKYTHKRKVFYSTILTAGGFALYVALAAIFIFAINVLFP